MRMLIDAVSKGWIAPAADVAEVVRCRDCKYKNRDGNNRPWCDIHQCYILRLDGFCNEGQ